MTASHDELQRIEAANWRIAHEWAADLEIEYAGVDFGEVMAYDVLRVLGRLWRRHLTARETEEKQA